MTSLQKHAFDYYVNEIDSLNLPEWFSNASPDELLDLKEKFEKMSLFIELIAAEKQEG